MNTSQNGDPANLPASIPAVSIEHQRQEAEQRRAAYPYRFPRDRRQLGGKYSVEENARRLLRFFYFERRLMQALGAWTLSILVDQRIRSEARDRATHLLSRRRRAVASGTAQ